MTGYELFDRMCRAETKAELVDAFYDYGLTTTTHPTETITKNDQYLEFADGSRIQICKKTICLWTNPIICKNADFISIYDKFTVVNDGSYRTRRATLPKDYESFKLILNHFVKDSDNWLSNRQAAILE